LGFFIISVAFFSMKRKGHDTERCALQKMSVLEFFQHDANWDAVRRYVAGACVAADKSDGACVATTGGAEKFEDDKSVSLRMIDYFVTNYARKILCEVDTPRGRVNIYQSMQSALRGLNKKRMDPFCRQHVDSDGITLRGVKTNVAQLSFFRWAIINGVLGYIEAHAQEIRDDMRAAHARQAAAAAAPGVAASGAAARPAVLAIENGVPSVPSSALTIRNVVIELPRDMVEENPGELDRLRITLEEKMQRPRRMRKRLNKEALEVTVRFTSAGSAFQTGDMRV